MSIQSEIDRINGNVASTYSRLSDLGADMPATTDTNNLPATAASVKAVLFGKSQSLTEAQKAQARTNIGAASAEDVGNIATTEEIVQQVIAALGTPVFGRVDEDNNIILSGELANGTYTLKYEDAEGNQTVIGTLENGEPEPAYTNMLLQAVENDGTLYNGGKGWKDGYRLNSSGTESADAAADVTGFIPVKWGDTLYLSEITMTPNSANPSKTYMYVYSSDYVKLGAYFRGDSTFSHATTNGGIVLDSNGNVKSIEMSDKTFTTVPSNAGNTAYVRFSCDMITDESIVTVNEPIA